MLVIMSHVSVSLAVADSPLFSYIYKHLLSGHFYPLILPYTPITDFVILWFGSGACTHSAKQYTMPLTCFVLQDPGARRAMWDFVVRATESGGPTGDGMAVVLTTHALDECEALCSRVGIMHQVCAHCNHDNHQHFQYDHRLPGCGRPSVSW
jgi:hypothetical protein